MRCFIWKVAGANMKFAHSLPSFLYFSRFFYLSFSYAISFPLFSSIIYKDNIISLHLRTKLQTGMPVEIKWLSVLNWKCTQKERQGDKNLGHGHRNFSRCYSATQKIIRLKLLEGDIKHHVSLENIFLYCRQAERWSEGLGLTQAKERHAGRQQDANLTLKEVFKFVFSQSFGFSILYS